MIEYDKIPPRELDAALARKLFGWLPLHASRCPYTLWHAPGAIPDDVTGTIIGSDQYIDLPMYSTDQNLKFPVLVALRELGLDVGLEPCFIEGDWLWRAALVRAGERVLQTRWCESLSRALCEAALSAVLDPE